MRKNDETISCRIEVTKMSLQYGWDKATVKARDGQWVDGYLNRFTKRTINLYSFSGKTRRCCFL